MNHIEDELNAGLNNNIPPHDANFWTDLDAQLSKHTPVDVENASTNVVALNAARAGRASEPSLSDDQLATPVLELASEQSPRRQGSSRNGLGFLAVAAGLVAALGFAVSTLPSTSSTIDVAAPTPIDYTQIQLESETEVQQQPDLPTRSGEELTQMAIAASDLEVFTESVPIAPSAVSPDGQHALYRAGNTGDTFAYVAIDQSPDLDSIVVFDQETVGGDPSATILGNASFSPAGPVVAIPHLDGIIIWNYQTNDVIFYTICPGIACVYNTQDRPSDTIWFDPTGTLLHFELVSDDGATTPATLVFNQPKSDEVRPSLEDGESEVPNVFDGDE